MGLEGLSPPSPKQKQKCIPKNEMKPISLFGLWAYVFCVFNIILDQLKEPVAGGCFFSLPKILVKFSAEISPPKTKFLATSLLPLFPFPLPRPVLYIDVYDQ